MKTFYAVYMTVYDHGEPFVTIGEPVEAESKPVTVCKSTSRADYWCDYFETKAEAEAWVKSNQAE